jgi:hypothetical protein
MHYASWVELAKDSDYDAVHLMLVSGYDCSQDYAMMTSDARDNKLSVSVTVKIPNLASFWGSGCVTSTIHGSPHYNYGPRPVESNNQRLERESPSESAAQPVQSRQGTLCLQSTESNNPTLQQESPSEPAAQPAQNRYVTFVRGWHMVYRLWIFPVMKAAAEPKDLDPEDPDPKPCAEVVSNVPSEVRIQM